MTYDVAVIGGGIIGLSVAMQASERYPGLRLVVLEKEEAVAQHQSRNNSGVIHSGVYYTPGSLKARLSVVGARDMLAFCARHAIPYEICGKVIVACNFDEVARLDELHARGVANRISGLRILDANGLREVEPHADGFRALHVPSTGITDYAAVARKFAEIAVSHGADVVTGAEVVGFDAARDVSGKIVALRTRSRDISARYVVNCAGLYSDRIARMAGHDPKTMVVPFRGEYYALAIPRRGLVRGLIYPVPDPRYPFLGVHFTRRIDGSVDAGPNAVLAFRREGYRWRDFHLGETVEVFRDQGFRALARREWKSGFAEFLRSLRKRGFLRSCQRLMPELKMDDLASAHSGVRAQAVATDGSLVEDFKFVKRDRFLHVVNVPSPAATASLPIGREILNMLPHEIVNH